LVVDGQEQLHEVEAETSGGKVMGCEAEIICIGKLSLLQREDALDYPEGYYKDVPKDAEIISTVVTVSTTSSSDHLAHLCGVTLWGLGHHRITCIPDIQSMGVDEYDLCELRGKLRNLLAGDATLWFRPNG
jgi:hypothetical protein